MIRRPPRLFLFLGNPDDREVQASSLYFRLQAGYGFFGNAGILEREKFKKETVQYRGPVGPEAVAKT